MDPQNDVAQYMKLQLEQLKHKMKLDDLDRGADKWKDVFKKHGDFPRDDALAVLQLNDLIGNFDDDDFVQLLSDDHNFV